MTTGRERRTVCDKILGQMNCQGTLMQKGSRLEQKAVAITATTRGWMDGCGSRELEMQRWVQLRLLEFPSQLSDS